jgi:hypothetical protein
MNRFTAYDDNLTPYVIVLGTAEDRAEGLGTEDGRKVTRIERGEYDILDAGETIRVWSDDPKGP